MEPDRCCNFLDILFAIILPPLGVFLHSGCCSVEFFLSIVLTLFGYIPGIIFAVYVIVVARGSDERCDRDYYDDLA